MHVDRCGAMLVLGSAVTWSLGGAIALYLDIPDNWATVVWQSLFAAAFLLRGVLLREGLAGTLLRGGLVFMTRFAHLGWQFRVQSQSNAQQ